VTEHDTGWGHPPDPEVAQHGEQPQDGLAGPPRIGELEPNADQLADLEPAGNKPGYLCATSCLAGSLVSVGLAVTEWAAYADHSGVGILAILGMIIGGLAGLAAAVSVEKPHGWADRIKIVAAWLALVGFVSLLFLYGGLHGWGSGGINP
jgi:hypothetical protein